MKRLLAICVGGLILGLTSPIAQAKNPVFTLPVEPVYGTVAGIVTDASGSPMAGVTLTGFSANTASTTVTDGLGSYNFQFLMFQWYVISPVKSGYTFSPLNASGTLDAESVTANFVGASVNLTYQVAGRVTNQAGASLSNVSLVATGTSYTSTISNAGGYYTLGLPAGGYYTVRPARSGFTFSPVSLSYGPLSSHQYNQNYLGTSIATYYWMSGRVTTSAGAGIQSVQVAVAYPPNTGYAYTDINGNYSIALPVNVTFTATPNLSGYAFSPANRSGLMSSNITGQNFTGTPTAFQVSGRAVDAGGASLSNVSLVATGTSTQAALSNASGYYTLSLPAQGTYTVTPNKSGYTFSPVRLSYTNLSSNQTGQNYVGTVPTPTYTVSGTVRNLSGQGMGWVTVEMRNGASYRGVATLSSGAYTFDQVSAGTYTLTAVYANYTFAPEFRAITVTGHTANQDFTGSSVVNPVRIIGQTTRSDTGAAIYGIQLQVSGGATLSTLSNYGGYYTLTVGSGSNYTVTATYPGNPGWTFSPASRSYQSLTNDQLSQNYLVIPPAGGYTVSGTVQNSLGQPLAGVTLQITGSATQSLVTTSLGAYSVSLAAFGSYTVTPSKPGYTFSPFNRFYSTLSANWTGQDYTGTLLTPSTYTFAGTIRNGAGVGLGGLTVSLNDHRTAATDINGNYQFSGITLNAYVVATPVNASLTFSPVNRSVIMTGHALGQDFTAAAVNPPATYQVSGRVTDPAGASLAGVSLVATGTSYTSTWSNASGYYTLSLPGNGTFTVTPSKPSYTFVPMNRIYATLSANQFNQDFQGNPPAPLGYTVSGTVKNSLAQPLSGVTLRITGSAIQSLLTNSLGAYSVSLAANGSYTFTPSKPGYTFAPLSRTYATLSANHSAQDYTGFVNAPTSYTLYGNTSNSAGQGLANVLVRAVTAGSTLSAFSNSSGSYVLALSANFTYTLTPSKTGYAFTPVNRTVTMTGTTFNQNFTGVTNAIVGRVTDQAGSSLSNVSLVATGTAYVAAMSNFGGYYTLNVPQGGSYTVTPSKTGYVFTPASRSYSTLSANHTGQDYTALIQNTLATYNVSGTVSYLSGTLASGVLLTVVSQTVQGTTYQWITTNSTGTYGFNLPANSWSQVTAMAEGFTFTPASYTYATLTGNLTNQNFTVTSVIMTLEEPVPLPIEVMSDGTAMFQLNAARLDSRAVKYRIKWRLKSTPVWHEDEIVVAGARAAALAQGAAVMRSPFPTKVAGTIEYQMQAVGPNGETSSWSPLQRAVMDTNAYTRLINDVSNYPNPFDSRKTKTTVVYALKSDARVTLSFFDAFGQSVASMEFAPGAAGGQAGTNEVVWDGTNTQGQAVAGGTYLCVIKAVAGPQSDRVVRKILLIH